MKLFDELRAGLKLRDYVVLKDGPLEYASVTRESNVLTRSLGREITLRAVFEQRGVVPAYDAGALHHQQERMLRSLAEAVYGEIQHRLMVNVIPQLYANNTEGAAREIEHLLRDMQP